MRKKTVTIRPRNFNLFRWQTVAFSQSLNTFLKNIISLKSSANKVERNFSLFKFFVYRTCQENIFQIKTFLIKLCTLFDF